MGETLCAAAIRAEGSYLVLIRAKKDLQRVEPTWVDKYSLASTHRMWQSLAKTMKESN